MSVLQGQIYWADDTTVQRAAQRGRRPVIVLQNDAANKYLNSTVVALISSSGEDDMPEMVRVGPDEGLSRPSHIDCAHIATILQSSLLKKIGDLKPEKWEKIEKALACIFYKTIS